MIRDRRFAGSLWFWGVVGGLCVVTASTPAAAQCPEPNEIEDCNGHCAPISWIGDGVCDNGSSVWPPFVGFPIYFNCDAFLCDLGDCDCGGGSGCPDGEIEDCNGNCAPAIWVGDGTCDDGAYTWPEFGGVPIFFNCAEHNCDNGDCTCPVTSCCEVHETPGCDTPECQAAVCAIDSFCCTDFWDQYCVDEAAALCGSHCGGAIGSCCESHESPGCETQACQAAVCAVDNSCCTSEWDGNCAFLAQELCGALCPTESCCEFHMTPGCSDSSCQATVCAADPYCCNNHWDEICVGRAQELCGGLCDVVVQGDCNDDGAADMNDVPCFVDAMLGIDTVPPGGIARSNVSGDSNTDGVNIQYFVNLLVP